MVIQASGVESHHAMGVVERYHTPLRRVFNAVRIDDPGLSDELSLPLVLKAVNVTMGPDGLVPSLLLYVRLYGFPAHETYPRQACRKRTVAAALSVPAHAACESSIYAELRSHLPPSARVIIHTGSKMRVSRE